VADNATSDREAAPAFGRIAGVAVIVGIFAAAVGGSTMWLLVTDPVTVATAVENGQISPLVRQLAQVILDAISSLLDYL
jgi:hypothetical protein